MSKKNLSKANNFKILILAGGKGTRLWPVSRSFKPKQFQKFLGNLSLFQMTLQRALNLTQPKNIFVSTNQNFFDEVQSQLPKDFPKNNIILEPAFRERVAAFLLFFCYLSKKELKEPVVVFPSDHLIKKENNFFEAIRVGIDFVRRNRNYILLFGEKPKSPEVGLGYIKKGKLLKKIGKFSFFEVELFKEKPNLKTAKEFIKSKKFFWNSGIFVFIPKLIENLTKKFVFNNWQIYQILKKNFKKKNFSNILKEKYQEMDPASFDYSILENYSKNAVLSVDFGWSDIGSWSALKECLAKKDKNYIKGNYLGIDSKDILVYGTTPQLVATCGVKNLIIVVTDDVVFICPKEKSQDVKKLVERIEKDGKTNLL